MSILLSAAAALSASNPRGFAVLAGVLGRRWSAPGYCAVVGGSHRVRPQTQLVVCLIVALVVSVCLVERTPLHPLLSSGDRSRS